MKHPRAGPPDRGIRMKFVAFDVSGRERTKRAVRGLSDTRCPSSLDRVNAT